MQLTWGGHEGFDLSHSNQDVVLKDVWGVGRVLLDVFKIEQARKSLEDAEVG